MEHALHKKEMVVSKIWSVTLPCLMFKMKTAAHYELSQVEEILLTWVWHFHFWLDPINYAHFGLTLYLVGVTVTLHCSLTHLSWSLMNGFLSFLKGYTMQCLNEESSNFHLIHWCFMCSVWISFDSSDESPPFFQKLQQRMKGHDAYESNNFVLWVGPQGSLYQFQKEKEDWSPQLHQQ